MIKFGYALTWNWANNLGIDFHRGLDDIALTGWEGVELNSGFLYYYLDHKEELKKLLDLHNLELTTFYSHLQMTNDSDFEAELNTIISKIKLIKKLGSDILLIDGGYKNPEGIVEKDYKNAIQKIKRICDLAYSENVKPTWHIHWGTLFDNQESFENMMDSTDDDGLCFCPDTAQIFMSGMDPLVVLKKYRKRISYIHFKDLERNTFINKYIQPSKEADLKNNTLHPLSSAGKYQYLKDSFLDNGAFHINSEYRFTEIARGIIDFKPLVKLIKDIKFCGWIVIDQDYTPYKNIESMDVNFKNLKYLFEETY